MNGGYTVSVTHSYFLKILLQVLRPYTYIMLVTVDHQKLFYNSFIEILSMWNQA